MDDRFPTNSSILPTGPPGVGKFEDLMARIREDLRLGERVVFVSLDLHPNEVRARAKAPRAETLSPVDGVVEMRLTDTMDREIRIHHMRGYRVDAIWRPFVQLPEVVVSL